MLCPFFCPVIGSWNERWREDQSTSYRSWAEKKGIRFRKEPDDDDDDDDYRRKDMFCVHTVVPANTEKWTSYVMNGELFVNTFPARCKNNWRKINTIASIWRKNIRVYLSLNIIGCSKLSLFLELHSETVRISEQIMSKQRKKQKPSCIYLCQIKTIVYLEFRKLLDVFPVSYGVISLCHYIV